MPEQKEKWIKVPETNIIISTWGRVRNIATHSWLRVKRKDGRLTALIKRKGELIQLDIVAFVNENGYEVDENKCYRFEKCEYDNEYIEYKHKCITNRNAMRKCHDCGKPTSNYRCEECWKKIRGFGTNRYEYESRPELDLLD